MRQLHARWCWSRGDQKRHQGPGIDQDHRFALRALLEQ